ncbi:MAG: phosphoenolpyruvate--protein phosphotransferase [Oscillospiraceae bacterium]|nr:MAG: phosphoenolpyruvate--protein phosphotransferase [Firmicutes bacterium CAG:137_57_8]
MNVLHGEGVCAGVAGGKLHVLHRQTETPKRQISDPEGEIARFDAARERAIAQLAALEEETQERLGQEQALLFQIHQMMLEDLDYRESVTGIISGQLMNAEYAVDQTAAQFSQIFAQMDDAYMQQRASDVLDVSRRLISVLMGREEAGWAGDEPVILAADDLVPSETARLDRQRVLAFVTAQGTGSSHTAIFARTMGIPAVVGLGDALLPDYDGREVYVDGAAGEVYIDPDPETKAQLISRREALLRLRQHAEQYRGVPATTPEGKRIQLCANIGSPKDLEAVEQGDGDGIGLFRSEFLYLGRDDYPSEEDQYRAYRQVVQAMAGRMVVVRTLDIGADKQASYFALPQEENPAMGMRAIRICLTRPQIFRTQLRALYRASVHGNLAIMFPMITSLEEVRQVKEICRQVRQELQEAGVPFRAETPLGIMIETPAAALISDRLAPEVDFFSIGTNDLTQYTLAVDRQNGSIGAFCNPHHEAVLRLIRYTAEQAHQAGIWVGICGELAADPSLTQTFVEMGIDELSMSPGKILETKARILDRA